MNVGELLDHSDDTAYDAVSCHNWHADTSAIPEAFVDEDRSEMCLLGVAYHFGDKVLFARFLDKAEKFAESADLLNLFVIIQ